MEQTKQQAMDWLASNFFQFFVIIWEMDKNEISYIGKLINKLGNSQHCYEFCTIFMSLSYYSLTINLKIKNMNIE
ncbi:hypothetical protein DERF_003058 [Dermatophagoides farinae]|uniref:Uncharacterized protein n=1 Tax=Dermatophagoides farinae TaxID=6954 RepID=A0A922LB51_DERFA|nr:hypothetical protein DERF_003058 [Dermatophagoides farinae]